MTARRGRPRLELELQEHLIADLEERERLQELRRLYTIRAIAQRHGVARATVWEYYLAHIREDPDE